MNTILISLKYFGKSYKDVVCKKNTYSTYTPYKFVVPYKVI